jgi:hypothetical protein
MRYMLTGDVGVMDSDGFLSLAGWAGLDEGLLSLCLHHSRLYG